jgi:hypothetical protein
MENTFSLQRAGLLFIRQLTMQLKASIIALGAIVGILLMIGGLVVSFGNTTYTSTNFLGLAMPMFFIGGFVLTSAIFAELNNPHRGFLYLMLPATAMEKLLSAWAITSLLYTVIGIVVMMTVNLTLIAFSSVFSLNRVELVNLLSLDMLRMFGIYLTTQTIFLVGAIHFRRAQFFKTVLSLFALMMAISAFAVIIGFAVFHNELPFDNMKGNVNINLMDSEGWSNASKILFWVLLAPFMLIVTYFKIKEREV